MGGIEHVVVMGVSGCGKSSVARRLAAELDRPFAEGDDFHPPGNVAKMRGGEPLTTADREPWLDALRAWMDERGREGRSSIVACSALKRAYRDRLSRAADAVLFVHLETDPDTSRARIADRDGHFMPADLADSQFADLEPLAPDEHGHRISAEAPLDEVVDRALTAVRHTRSTR